MINNKNIASSITNLLGMDLNYSNYKALYDLSINNLELFWDICAKNYLNWFQPYDKVYSGNINNLNHIEDFSHNKWFSNGKLNVCYNCLDRHLAHNAEKIAYYWQGDELAEQSSVTYQELYIKVCKFSNVLLKLGMTKGDKVCIYLPFSIEAIVAMLACTRIGAVHTVVFAGFSAKALADRIVDAECKLLITTDSAKRGGKNINLWNYITSCVDILEQDNFTGLHKVLYVDNNYSVSNFKEIVKLFNKISLKIGLVYYQDLVTTVDEYCEPACLDAEDPLFILYTSGSTGKPKGILHTTAGYLLQSVVSFHKLFNIDQEKYPHDVYWSTADIGWITGHSYVVYGALANAVTSVIFSGTPNYPDHDIFWQIIDKYKVTLFYAAPTAIRALMKEGTRYLTTTSRDSLRLLGTVGEPINSDAWQWYFSEVGKERCPILDTWWQTETGAIMLSPLPTLDILKPGCAMLPFLGVKFAILNADGQEIINTEQGSLVIKNPWPSMVRTVYQNHNKFTDTYCTPYKNYFYTGDLAKLDEDGHYWIFGRGDDVLNISGHRFGTAEIESALLSHSIVAEAAVVPVPDPIKGQVLYAFVTLNDTSEKKRDVSQDLVKHVKSLIGSIVVFKDISIVSNLPKTRSGKIMRRILKKIAAGETDDLGDLSTLLNQDIINELIKELK